MRRRLLACIAAPVLSLTFVAAVTETAEARSGSAAVAYANAQVGKRYRFAGVGPSAFDCSGLTMMAFRRVGVSLPHGSRAQGRAGRSVSKNSIQAGDLLILDGGNHAAIAVSSTQMVDAANSRTGVRRISIPKGRVMTVRRF